MKFYTMKLKVILFNIEKKTNTTASLNNAEFIREIYLKKCMKK